MAGPILEEDEIQTLLEGLEEGAVQGGEGGSLYNTEEVQPYHFSEASEEEIPELPAFEVIAQRFERFFSDSMVGEFPVLRPGLAYRGYDMERFGEVAEEASNPGIYLVVRTDQGQALLTMEVTAARMLVGAILGEEQQNMEEMEEGEQRELTKIEQRLFQRLLNALIQDLERAWEPLYLHQVQDVRLESYIRDASIVRRDVRVFRMTYNLTLGEYESPVMLIYPAPMLDPYLDLLRGDFLAGGAEVDAEWREQFQEEIFKASTTVQVALGHSRLTLRDLLELEVGHFFYLDQKTGDPVEVWAGGRRRWWAEAGKVDGQMAVRLLEPVEPGESREEK